jgi:pimeloyl-[acyl-carrier protein] methyl ester esterase
MDYQVIGSGVLPLVLIHGWGMNANVWKSIEEDLSQHFTMIVVNLPGMGSCHPNKHYTMSDILDELNEFMPDNSTLLGWSLGGQIAMAYQKKFPKKIKNLILVSSTPCFINKKDWLYGIEKDIFEKFSLQLLVNWKKTLHQFFLLQFQGLPNMRAEAIKFEKSILKLGKPDPIFLLSSLKLLMDIDCRKDLKYIKANTLVIGGDMDKLTPFASSEYLAEIIPKSVLKLLPGSGHVPFLFDPDFFVKTVLNFVKE